jgi:4-hydroxy-tetrahydrodipicolinate synthase
MRVFNGILPPIPTPFHEDYSINEEVLRSLVDHLVAEGVHAIIPTGSSGEFTRLSMDERKRVVEICVDQAQGRIPVIAGTAAAGTEETVELSRHADSVGASGLQIVAPFYAPISDSDVYDHYARIGEAVSIPILVYNNPKNTGIDMSAELIAKMADIPNVEGVKESSRDTMRIRQIIALAGDRIAVYGGVDDYIFEAFALGARGWIAGSANVLPRHCVEFYEALVVRGDLDSARKQYFEIMDLCDKIESRGNPQNIKAALEILGFNVGPPRPPLQRRGKAEIDELRRLMEPLVKVPA